MLRLMAGALWGFRRALGVVAAVAVVAGAQAAAGGAPTQKGTAHERVRTGDTLSAIATRVGVAMSDLAAANGIDDPDRIRAGDRLVVPRPSPAASSPRPSPGASPASGRNSLPATLRASPDRLALLPVFDAAAQRYGLPADLLKALTWLESGWQNHKVSSTKALGIGQLMPATVEFVNGILLRANLDPRRPEDNIVMSARFLAYLLDRTDGDVSTALASYYQGLASVRRHGPGGPTRAYVADVVALRRKF